MFDDSQILTDTGTGSGDINPKKLPIFTIAGVSPTTKLAAGQ